eukprot:763232-Hanusia_phi.AAC.2
MSFSFFSRPHPLVPPVATFQIQQANSLKGYDNPGNFANSSTAWSSAHDASNYWRKGEQTISPLY